ncbi:hypothetical protein GPJ56_007015 [Histomonas meleagridis]|nr:hypothetical protein GPJ56_007015 [Histomonas meleagridis]
MSDNKDELDFWLNSDAVSESEISDDGDIQISSSSAQTPAKPKKKKNPKPDPEEQIEIIPPPSKVVPEPYAVLPEDQDMQYNYVESKLISDEKRKLNQIAIEASLLKNDIAQLLKETNSDSDVEIDSSFEKKEGDKMLFFKCESRGFNTQCILHSGEKFIDLFKKVIPEEYQEDYNVVIDGTEYNPANVLEEIIDDYSQVYLVMDKKSSKGYRKLSFLLPKGDRKKLSIDPTTTFKEVLTKLGYPNAKAYFDGEPLDVEQRICDNDEIEDEYQIDVVL